MDTASTLGKFVIRPANAISRKQRPASAGFMKFLANTAEELLYNDNCESGAYDRQPVREQYSAGSCQEAGL